MKTIRSILLLIVAGAVVASLVPTACAEGYVAKLKKKVPYYRTMTGDRAPMYEPLARQMVQEYGLRDGVALDIGSSTSPFLIELARKTKMRCYAVDIDPWALRLLGVFIDQAGLAGRVSTVEGDWQSLPLRSNFADFIFSRGTIPFIPDKVRAVRETYRVLKPGGVAYIGHGGFGTLLDPAMRERLVQWRLEWETGARQRPEGWDGPGERLPDLAREARIPEGKYRLITEPQVGWWLEIRK